MTLMRAFAEERHVPLNELWLGGMHPYRKWMKKCSVFPEILFFLDQPAINCRKQIMVLAQAAKT